MRIKLVMAEKIISWLAVLETLGLTDDPATLIEELRKIGKNTTSNKEFDRLYKNAQCQ